LTIVIATWREFLEAVSSGECDLGLTLKANLCLTFATSRWWETDQLYCGRSHPLYGHRARNPATVSNLRFILGGR
jgi:DNA-binding transcriptional LysR family regulator